MSLTVVAIVLGLIATAGQGMPSRRVALQELTVPAAGLPTGCRVPAKSSERSTASTGERVHSGLWTGLPITANPWAGSDRAIVAAIRERMEGAPRLPDGPPLSMRDAARHRLELADGVEEAYAAIYSQGESADLIVVYGLRFDDVHSRADTRWISSPRENPRAIRLALGPLAVAVHGDGGACFQAVANHVRGLAR